MAPLLPRPALILFSYVTSAVYLLEHAVWAHITSEPTAETDREVFRRWVDEGGFKSAIDDYMRVSRDTQNDARPAQNASIVYGPSAQPSATANASVRAHL